MLQYENSLRCANHKNFIHPITLENLGYKRWCDIKKYMNKHNIYEYDTPHKYFRKILCDDTIGKCVTCKTHDCTYSNKNGFVKYCCRACRDADPQLKALQSRIKLEKYADVEYKNKWRNSYNEYLKSDAHIEANLRIQETNMKRYGSKTTLGLKHVAEARYLAMTSEETNQKRRNWWEINENRKPEIEKLRIKTLLEKYGVINSFNIDYVKQRMFDTFESRNYIIHNDEYSQYVNIIRKLTLRNKKILFSNCKGVCEYTGELLLTEKGDSMKPNYRTIDHVIPISVGYKLKISPEFMGSLDNLKLCTRRYNIIKTNSITRETLLALKKYENELKNC